MEEILSRLKGFNPPDRCTVEDREAAEAIQGAIAEIERLRGEVVMEGEPGHETTWKKEAKSLFAMTERLRKLLETIRYSAIFEGCDQALGYTQEALNLFKPDPDWKPQKLEHCPRCGSIAIQTFGDEMDGFYLRCASCGLCGIKKPRFDDAAKSWTKKEFEDGSFPDPAMAIHNEESEKGLLETIKSIHADPRIVVRILEVEDCAGCPRNDGEICGLDTEVSTKSFLDGSFPARCPLEVKRT